MKTELLAWLINATVATSLASIAVLLMRKPLQRRLGAEIAYRLWIVMPLATLFAAFSLPRTVPVAAAAAQTAAAATATPSILVRVNAALAGSAADRWLIATWLLGACALSCVLVWQQRRFVSRLKLRRDGAGIWRSSMRDAAPAVLGLLRPRLVLPEGFESDYDVEERRLVIAHERMHQRRRDPLALAVCAGMRTLFWFNPIVHVAATRFRRDIESACDAAVLRANPGSRRRYADALLKTQIATGALPVGCLWHHTPPLKERIMLLKNAIPARRAHVAGAILVALAALGIAGFAMAEHDASRRTADALAASPANGAPFYMVKLDMSVDGKPVAHPSVIARAGDEAMVKIDEQGKAWGFRFHVAPEQGSKNKAVRIDGEVFGADEKHVVGHANLGMTPGTPGVIAMMDKAGGPAYRIVATVTDAPRPPPPPAPPLPPPPPGAAMAPPPPPMPPGQPGQQEERVIVMRGGPGGDAAVAPLPPLPPESADAPRGPMQTEEREVIVTTPGSGVAPESPLPPLPPNAKGRRVIVTVESKHGGMTPPPPPPDVPPTPDTPPPPPGH